MRTDDSSRWIDACVWLRDTAVSLLLQTVPCLAAALSCFLRGRGSGGTITLSVTKRRKGLEKVARDAESSQGRLTNLCTPPPPLPLLLPFFLYWGVHDYELTMWNKDGATGVSETRTQRRITPTCERTNKSPKYNGVCMYVPRHIQDYTLPCSSNSGCEVRLSPIAQCISYPPIYRYPSTFQYLQRGCSLAPPVLGFLLPLRLPFLLLLSSPVLCTGRRDTRATARTKEAEGVRCWIRLPLRLLSYSRDRSSGHTVTVIEREVHRGRVTTLSLGSSLNELARLLTVERESDR